MFLLVNYILYIERISIITLLPWLLSCCVRYLWPFILYNSFENAASNTQFHDPILVSKESSYYSTVGTMLVFRAAFMYFVQYAYEWLIFSAFLSINLIEWPHTKYTNIFSSIRYRHSFGSNIALYKVVLDASKMLVKVSHLWSCTASAHNNTVTMIIVLSGIYVCNTILLKKGKIFYWVFYRTLYLQFYKSDDI